MGAPREARSVVSSRFRAKDERNKGIDRARCFSLSRFFAGEGRVRVRRRSASTSVPISPQPSPRAKRGEWGEQRQRSMPFPLPLAGEGTVRASRRSASTVRALTPPFREAGEGESTRANARGDWRANADPSTCGGMSQRQTASGRDPAAFVLAPERGASTIISKASLTAFLPYRCRVAAVAAIRVDGVPDYMAAGSIFSRVIKHSGDLADIRSR